MFKRLIVIIIVIYTGCSSALQPHDIKQVVDKLENQNDISVGCRNSLKLYNDRLENSHYDNTWALSMLDATSNMPTSLLSHNSGEMGNFQQCIEIESKTDHIKGKYCLGTISVDNTTVQDDAKLAEDQFYSKYMQTYLKYWSFSAGYPTWAMCLPSNCSDQDSKYIMSTIQTIGSGTELIKCQTFDDANPPLHTDAFIGITVISLLLIIIISSTAYDIYCEINSIETKRAGYIAFSLYTNGKSLFKVPERTSNLSCLDGIRVISMMWIILHHTYMFYCRAALLNYNRVLELADSIISNLFLNGQLACDSFFLIGGTLVTYVFFKKENQDLLTRGGIIKHYFHRYIRLTPAYAGIIFITATLLRYFGSGPKWMSETLFFQRNCKNYWWSAMLYIQSEVNSYKACNVHTWYLEIDMKLFLLSPLIFWILMKRKKIGISVLALCAMLSIMSTFLRVRHFELTDVFSNYYSGDAFGSFMLQYYTLLDARASPWFMGTILGYFMAKKEVAKNSLNKKMVVPLWILSVAVMLLCVTSGQFLKRYFAHNRLQLAIYLALLRPTFSLPVAWVIWACANNYGGPINRFLSLPMFQFFNKFTYSMYLLHVNIIIFSIAAEKHPVYFSLKNMMLWFFGILVVVFISSIVWVLTLENPMIRLEKIIVNKFSRKKERK